jgi:hypothetical protein
MQGFSSCTIAVAKELRLAFQNPFLLANFASASRSTSFPMIESGCASSPNALQGGFKGASHVPQAGGLEACLIARRERAQSIRNGSSIHAEGERLNEPSMSRRFRKSTCVLQMLWSFSGSGW